MLSNHASRKVASPLVRFEFPKGAKSHFSIKNPGF